MLTSLRYFWRTNLAVIGAAAICAAVLAGALVVGDSVRDSLRQLTLERLGSIDHALLGESFFGQDLASRLEASEATKALLDAAAPAILLRGSVSVPESGARSSRIQIYGVDSSLADLFDPSEAGDLLSGLAKEEGQFLPSVVINEALRSELGVAVGDELILSLARPSDVPRESLLGSTEAADLISTRRAVLRGVLPNRGVGRFGLEPKQSLPLNAYLDLGEVQRALDRRDQVNAVLLAEGSETELESADFARQVESQLGLSDFGIELAVRDLESGASADEDGAGRFLELTSRDIVFRPQVETAILGLAAELGLETLSVSTYLANRTQRIGEGADGSSSTRSRMLPYATIAAIDLPSTSLPGSGAPSPFGSVTWVAGSPTVLADDQVLVNSWAAEDLGVVPGDRVEVEYWEVGEREQLLPRTIELSVVGIVELSGLTGDRLLTPPFPGVHDADDMSDWEPTFPVDLGLVGDRDEDYWDLYGATPKLFVRESLGRRLWSSRFGDLTSIRLSWDDDLGALAQRLRAELPGRIEPRAAGLSVLPVKEQGLRAAAGATDFAGLFVGFSLFLIVSAALLTVLFFRLGVERRASEIGARLALGFREKSVRRLLLGEGTILAGLGTVLGLLAAVGYAWLMILGLRTLWVGATGTSFLGLHVSPLSLVAGGLGSMLLVVLSVGLAVRKLASLPVVGLLRGVSRSQELGRPRRRARQVAVGSLVLALGLLAGTLAAPKSLAAPMFMALGAILVAGGLALFSLWLGGTSKVAIERPGWVAILQLARANAALNPGRSVLSAALVASAVFVIVAVGAYGHRFGDETRERSSGAGGFSLLAESDVPVYHDLNDPTGREELGFSSASSELIDRAVIVPLRVQPGDDVSCLNLYQPERPRLLGVPQELVERGGFQFQQVADGESANPWTLLNQELTGGAIPVIGDFNSVMWILKSGLGKDVAMIDESGREIQLRIVGLLRRSIFQSELLMAEDRLLEHFPSRSGYSMFLIQPEVGQDQETAEALEQTLGRFGFDTTTTAQRLESYQAVENTYLGTFQTLGGLGLLLGTLGLAVILLRSVLERRAELATLRAIGFRRSTLGWTVLAENTLLLCTGVGIGALAALIAIAPHLRGGQALVPWGSLVATLALVLLVGTVACAAAVRSVLASPLLPALRAE